MGDPPAAEPLASSKLNEDISYANLKGENAMNITLQDPTRW